MKAHHHLIRYALKQGNYISISSGNETVVNATDSFDNAITAAEQTKNGMLFVDDRQGQMIAWANFDVQQLSDRTVTNFDMNDFMLGWGKSYYGDGS